MAGAAAGVPLVINARTDAFEVKGWSPTERLTAAVRRANAYRAAGADCLFVPHVSDAATIGQLAREIEGPLNIIAGPPAPAIPELERLGVKRASLGPRVVQAALGLVRRAATELRERGTYDTMPAADRSRWASSRARELDPWREHDACGVGFVARASGHRSADIARLALQALARVAHRGAAATDRSGDGAGLLTQIPAPLFYREAASRGLALAPGQPFAVGSFFLPREHDALGCATAIIEEVLHGEGL